LAFEDEDGWPEEDRMPKVSLKWHAQKLRILRRRLRWGQPIVPVEVEVSIGAWSTENRAWNLAKGEKAATEILQRFGVRCLARVGSAHFGEVELIARLGEKDEAGWRELTRVEVWLWERRHDFGIIGEVQH
jgi:hypothetical protein